MGFYDKNLGKLIPLTDDHLNRIEKVKKYEDRFNYWGEVYGIDPKILMAIACHEGYGSNDRGFLENSNSYACGIMQIEKTNVGNDITAYNFMSKKYETISYSEEELWNIDNNIQTGAMLFRSSYNSAVTKYCNNEISKEDIIPFALQEYNMGSGNAEKLLRNNNNNWRNNRSSIGAGDSHYYEQVLAYVDPMCNDKNYGLVGDIYMNHKKGEDYNYKINCN